MTTTGFWKLVAGIVVMVGVVAGAEASISTRTSMEVGIKELRNTVLVRTEHGVREMRVRVNVALPEKDSAAVGQGEVPVTVEAENAAWMK